MFPRSLLCGQRLGVCTNGRGSNLQQRSAGQAVPLFSRLETRELDQQMLALLHDTLCIVMTSSQMFELIVLPD
jgi:hypothetical protein